MTIKTIGYGLKKIDEFVDKLKENKIKVLVDVRTRPFSRWNPKYSRAPLETELAKHNIKYIFKGNNLGGLGVNIDFETTVDEVVKLSSIVGLVVMCTETDYKKCHRFTVLTPAFEAKGVKVEHILWEKNNNPRLL
mgnify:CR=1 FL=1